MTSDFGGWPDTYSASDYGKLESENRRLRKQVEGFGGSTVQLTGELPVEHPLQQEVEHLRRHTKIAWDHAVAFKALMHGMQDEIDEKDRTIKRQRAIIAKLEGQLGIDQEL